MIKLPRRVSTPLLINVAGTLIAVFLAFSLITTVQQNYQLNRQIDTLSQQNSQLQQQTDELKYNIAYYGTDSFKDREARAKLGLQAPGEGVIILPQQSGQEATVPATSQPAAKPKSHLRSWLDFLTGKE